MTLLAEDRADPDGRDGAARSRRRATWRLRRRRRCSGFRTGHPACRSPARAEHTGSGPESDRGCPAHRTATTGRPGSVLLRRQLGAGGGGGPGRRVLEVGRRLVEDRHQGEPAAHDHDGDSGNRDEEHDLGAARGAVGMADDLPALVLAHRVDVGGSGPVRLLGDLVLPSSALSERRRRAASLDRPPGLLRCAIPSSNHTGGQRPGRRSGWAMRRGERRRPARRPVVASLTSRRGT